MRYILVLVLPTVQLQAYIITLQFMVTVQVPVVNTCKHNFIPATVKKNKHNYTTSTTKIKHTKYSTSQNTHNCSTNDNKTVLFYREETQKKISQEDIKVICFVR